MNGIWLSLQFFDWFKTKQTFISVELKFTRVNFDKDSSQALLKWTRWLYSQYAPKDFNILLGITDMGTMLEFSLPNARENHVSRRNGDSIQGPP